MSYILYPSTDAYTTEQLTFHWRDAEAVELNEELELPQFNLDKVSIVESCVKKYHTGNYTISEVALSYRLKNKAISKHTYRLVSSDI